MDHALLDHRWAMNQQFGAQTLDKMVFAYACPSCGASVADPNLTTVAAASYEDLDSLVRHAIAVASKSRTQDAPTCPDCETAARLVHVDYHAYHPTADRDVVARCLPPSEGGEWTGSAAWWNPTLGRVPLDRFDEAQALDFALAAASRRLVVAGMSVAPELDDIVAAAQRGLDAHPGHPMLLDLGRGLMPFGRTGIAGAIADTHITEHPEDGRGHALLGEVIFMVVNHGALPSDAIHEAVAHLEEAVRLDPSAHETAITLANAYRFEGREDRARSVLESVVQQDPHCGVAQYTLGLMSLAADDPATAVRHFQAGEASDADDADYPIGCARALVSLGRHAEAKAALDRARRLDPEHPRLRDLEASLE